MTALKLIVMTAALICMVWSMAGRWRGFAVPVSVIFIDLIATIGVLAWMLWISVRSLL